ncbi:MAG: hypothetical protein WD709_06430, partial [Gammaproteobacteria bacterium]
QDMHSKLGSLTDNTNQAMGEIQASITDLRQLLTDARRLVAEDSPQVQKLDTALDEIASAARTIRDLEQLPQMQRLDETLGEISAAARTIGTFEDSPQMYNLNTALEEISAAARAMRILADTLERNPESLLRGKNLQE